MVAGSASRNQPSMDSCRNSAPASSIPAGPSTRPDRRPLSLIARHRTSTEPLTKDSPIHEASTEVSRFAVYIHVPTQSRACNHDMDVSLPVALRCCRLKCPVYSDLCWKPVWLFVLFFHHILEINKMLSYRRETALQGALLFWLKVEDWNWETIFYGHCRPISSTTVA